MEKRLFNEDETTDNLKDKQSREKEQLKIKHDREMDADRRLTRLKNRITNQMIQTKYPMQLYTKEKIYKDLKKKKDYLKKNGDKAKVMHGTAMNMAKKQHKVAEVNLLVN